MESVLRDWLEPESLPEQGLQEAGTDCRKHHYFPKAGVRQGLKLSPKDVHHHVTDLRSTVLEGDSMAWLKDSPEAAAAKTKALHDGLDSFESPRN